jgi:hypothetical protein
MIFLGEKGGMWLAASPQVKVAGAAYSRKVLAKAGAEFALIYSVASRRTA